MIELCSSPIQQYANGNAGPRFCGNGALVVEAWTYYGPIDPHLLSVGPNPTVTAVESAMCADGRELHATNVMQLVGYELAAAYYGWHLDFDPQQFIMSGTCP